LNGEEFRLPRVPPNLGSGSSNMGAGRSMRREADSGSMRRCVTTTDGGDGAAVGLNTGVKAIGLIFASGQRPGQNRVGVNPGSG
jgi:hypothetical protein